MQRKVARALSIYLVGSFVARELGTPPNEAVVDRSVAVLPFASIGTVDCYLADGITAELTDSLAAIPDIRIASYDNNRVPLADGELARVLKVGHLIKGTVQMVGDNIRTRVQLVRACDSSVLWSFQSDKLLHDLFDLQDNIAKKNLAIFLKSTLYKEALARRRLGSACGVVCIHG